MNAVETAAKIERARRRREDELLLLLLLLCEDGESDLIVALRHGFSTHTVLQNTFARAVPVISGAMADAHVDAFGRFGSLSGDVSRADAGDVAAIANLYEGQARAAADAMTSTVYQSVLNVQAKFPAESPEIIVRSAFDNVGYSRESAYGLDQGAERNIVFASNIGMIQAALFEPRMEAPTIPPHVLPKQMVGLTHFSVVDDRTTDICLARHMLTLPADHPYWTRNCPPLHGRCRSIILPVFGKYEADTVFPTVPPMPGWGAMPSGFIAEILRAA